MKIELEFYCTIFGVLFVFFFVLPKLSIKNVKMNSVLFFYIISSIILGFVVVKSIPFEEMIVPRITLATADEYDDEGIDYENNALVRLEPEDRMSLCRSVYTVKRLPFMNDEFVYEPEVYHFLASEDEDYFKVGIKCPTLPPAYVMNFDEDREAMDSDSEPLARPSGQSSAQTSVQPSEQKSFTVVFANPFAGRFSFDIEIVQRIERSETSANVSDEESEVDLFNISPEAEDRWNLCFIATKHTHRKINFLQQTIIDEPRPYKSNKAGMKIFNAIDCKTTPNMFLRVKGLDAPDPVIKMIFVEDQLKGVEMKLSGP